VEIEVPRPYREHAPRSIESTSTSLQAEDASRFLTAYEVALNDNGVNCGPLVGSQVVGGWESREVLCRRERYRLNREGRGLFSTVNNV
jgi:hypothetical protein